MSSCLSGSEPLESPLDESRNYEYKTLNTAPLLRLVIAFAAGLNLLIGVLFFFGPGLAITLWPSSLPREMMRFTGSIVFANGIGAAMIVRRPTWENARVLVAVALMYGAAVFFGLFIDLIAAGAPPIFWIYLVVNTLFLIPVAYFFWKYEQSGVTASASEAVSR